MFKPRGHPRALDLSPLVVPQKLPFIHLLAGHSSFSGKLGHQLGSRDEQSWYGHGSRGGRNQQQRQRGEGCGSGFSGCTKSLLYCVRAPVSNMLDFFWGGCYIEGVLLTSNKEVAKTTMLPSQPHPCYPKCGPFISNQLPEDAASVNRPPAPPDY